MNILSTYLFLLYTLCNISYGMWGDCTGCGCWYSSSIRRRRREERQRQRLAQLNEPFGATLPTPKPTTNSPTLSPTSPPTLIMSYAQQIVNHKCPSGVRKCILDNYNLETLQNVQFPSSIQQLFISRNNLRSLENVQFPSDLTFLSLHKNKITLNDKDLINLSYLRSLEILNLESNRIKSLNNVILPRSLKELNIRDNQFESISFGVNVFRLNNLDRIDLGLNRLDILKGNLTKKLPQNLQVLKVDMNHIELVEHVTLPLSLQRLDLRNNPLVCFDVTNIKLLLSAGINVQLEGTQLTNGQLRSKVRNIPTQIWNVKKYSNITKECQVCCEEFKNGDVIRTLPCLHQYHCKCVDKWLGDHGDCPLCRHPIDKNEFPSEEFRNNKPPHRSIVTPSDLNYL